VELPDGRRGAVPAAGLADPRDPAPGLHERIDSLIGTPYLWGGRTPAGIDCSAFVQLVYAERGIALPRDARDQHRACRRLGRGEKDIPGDLVFFAAPGQPVGHVGIGMGDGWFAHSRGRVQLASLDPYNPLCDKALLPQSKGWFRVPGARRERERRPGR
jgi:cell wall-associated NlpC family hydrolase